MSSDEISHALRFDMRSNGKIFTLLIVETVTERAERAGGKKTRKVIPDTTVQQINDFVDSGIKKTLTSLLQPHQHVTFVIRLSASLVPFKPFYCSRE